MRYLVCVLLFSLLAACADSTPLKIGFIGGLTGRFADLGTSGRNGAILAVDMQNARGGIRGRPVTLLIRDDEHDPLHARQAFGSLLKEEVQAVVGPMTSAMAIELAPLATEAGIVLMGGTIVTDQLSATDDFFLRPISAASHYAVQTAQAHLKRFGKANTVVIYDQANRDYAENWSRNYAGELHRQGHVQVKLLEFDSGREKTVGRVAGQALQHLRTVDGGKPGLIVFVCSARDAAGIARAVRADGTRVDLAGSGWPATQQFIEQAGTAAENALFEQYHDRKTKTDGFTAFTNEYQRRFDREPDYAAVVAFDAMQTVLQALERNPRASQLKQTLLAGTPFKGLRGEIRFDPYGDVDQPAHFALVRGGLFVHADP